MKLNIFLKKLDRVVAWVLAALFLAMMISGYMNVKGFHRGRGRGNLIVLGVLLHTQLDLPIMLLFSIHFAINLKFALMRYGFKDSFGLNLFCLIIALTLLSFIVYLDLH
ncbi:hypothetical protein KEJ50_06270 [Candidatus Bathyarchaeota archaeon]|nr:hypothetical protein [Candidatus Bathyarchaeota archaeon]